MFDKCPPLAAADPNRDKVKSSEASSDGLSSCSQNSGRVSTGLTVNKVGHHSNEPQFTNPTVAKVSHYERNRSKVAERFIRRPLVRSQTTATMNLSSSSSSSSTARARSFIAFLSLGLLASAQLIDGQQQQPFQMYRLGLESRQAMSSSPNGRPSPYSLSSGNNPHHNNANIPQNWPRASSPPLLPGDHELSPTTTTTTATNTNLMRDSSFSATSVSQPQSSAARRSATQATLRQQQQPPKAVRHIVNAQAPQETSSHLHSNMSSSGIPFENTCADRLCYGLPQGCQLGAGAPQDISSMAQAATAANGHKCNVLVTSKRFIDPNRPVSRDILFELIALPVPDQGNYAAVGFSETGRMQGLVSECLQYRDTKTQVQIIKLKHSYNLPGAYHNVPVQILSGIKNFGVSFEDGHYQCRWIVESGVEFTYEAVNGTLIRTREDLGYRNYHILLATGEYNQASDAKGIHTDRVSSMAPISLAQTGHIRSLGAHILIRIHGSLMIAIWVGLVTLSVIMARYYKNEWANSKINDLAIWFVVHRALMLTAWFGSIIAVIFAYMYTETYHPAAHQISGSACLILITIQVVGGLFRPSHESSKRSYFNWTHFICGNISYLMAMVCLVTAAFLRPAHLPPLYIWVVVAFVATYALAHIMMTAHQYITHRSSKISITPMSKINSQFVGDSYLEDTNSPFRQFMLGILVTIVGIFIVILISLVNVGSGSTRTT